jgi:hypothetical protein
MWGWADLHRRFPGTTVDDERAFDLLWAGRRSAPVAGIECAVPDLVHQRVILLLNAARGGPRADHDLTVAWLELDDEQRRAIRAAAASLGADVALAAAIGELDHHTHARDHNLWKVTSQGGTRTEEWLARIKAAPTTRERVRVALSAPKVNTEHLAVRLGHEPTRPEVAVEFVNRAWRALTETTARLAHRVAGRRSGR